MWGGKEGRRIKMHPLKLAEKEAVISDVFYRELCGDGHGQYILRGFTWVGGLKLNHSVIL